MDQGVEEVNVLLPAIFADPPSAISALKGFGFFGFSLLLVLVLALGVLVAYAPY